MYRKRSRMDCHVLSRQALPPPKSRHCRGSACPKHGIHRGTTALVDLTNTALWEVNNYCLCINERDIDDQCFHWTIEQDS